MSQAENLLNKSSARIADPSVEGHIVIDPVTRIITIPEELKRIAVQYDHNIETVTFDCPRYWDEHDMSLMKIYINYMRSDDETGSCLATNVVVDEYDEDIIHFDWTIEGFMTAIPGPISFLVCVKKPGEDENEMRHWNSELSIDDIYVSEGLEAEAIVYSHYPGIITSLLHRMDVVENKTTRDAMLGYVEAYLTETSPNWLETFFVSDTILNIVKEYMEANGINVSTHIAVSTEKPDRECIWFHVTNVVSDVKCDENNIYITDPETRTSYKIHVVNGKLTMSELYVESNDDVYLVSKNR